MEVQGVGATKASVSADQPRTTCSSKCVSFQVNELGPIMEDIRRGPQAPPAQADPGDHAERQPAVVRRPQRRPAAAIYGPIYVRRHDYRIVYGHWIPQETERK